jgi:2-oxo-4-hydroxy-4-carboxy-5-ureidoimidazoline decarboxylase
MNLDQVNSLSQPQFVAEFGWIFEHSPWVAERAWSQRPFGSVESLHAAMRAVMENAAHEEQLGLLRAHPKLGSRRPMSNASTGEQSRAGLSGFDQWQQEALQQYREKFGFPFLYAVKGSTVEDIFIALGIRSKSTPEEEFQQALREVSRIAWFRLQAKFKES